MTVANLTTTVEEITDREIGLWKMRTVPLPKIDDALYEVKRGKAVKKNLFPKPSLAGQLLPAAGGDGAWTARTGSGPMLMHGD